MSSCERLSPKQFHSQESRLYTEKCVRELMQTRAFRDYVGHLEYSERMQFSWFVALIGLALASYYHAIFMFPVNCGTYAGNFDEATPFFLVATLLMALFVAPSVMVAQISGFFEPISREEVSSLLTYITFVNAAVVSFGGSWLHNPPYIVSEPPVPWLSGTISQLDELATRTILRALPLHGIVVGSWLLYLWQSRGWRRVWKLPLPLLTAPVLLAVFTWFWFRVTSPICAQLLSSSTDALELVDVFFSASDEMIKSFSSIFSTPLRLGAFISPQDCCRLWCSTLAFSLLYFAGALAIPVIGGIAILISWVLPTHPTTWGLSFILSIAGLVMQVQRNESSVVALFALLVAIWALGRNGFSLMN
ncbi:uncharacterized protein TEOVI_000026000 [Trypanosoma equiperdum]|uniref:Uncharacterized protein n=3 Tax=Trypanozoon TaxID=39700 RepID=Q57XK0_TRYB2|nr:hypothetical protein, conserved [Trypanosoma brucei gambiense DAL972]XP_843942.1 hypothetical protein, conserved [Trypanosoma brucei brucei TREU927]AAX69669.1 hypothetical protein, conserved [Trypanosoma brucei]SCU66050.1 hypothetical protein, conserved [Trypanosoma equiperdum]AAZ10383.1 hypothetical protein, conserved [Trypanosoma brucei brucei TREU927]CBH10035.1 hypothetical protein, conserved [Trypanosoma brucei gambiense DAL972]|eukprot:XP_011772325.1 hypothetical protein, conserved [Trypanosoma brucei gambiense DAL972]